MSLEVITGRAGSGKSRQLMQRISALVKDPFAKIIVIVPGPLTFETEKSILQSCGIPGILGLEVLSIQRLAFKVLEETGAPAFMSGAEKAMAAHLALLAMDAPFGGSGHLPEFETCLGALFTQLKSFGQTPHTLRKAAQDATDTALSAKLLETADIYEHYIAICGARLDMADMYTLAAQRAKQAAFLQGAHVFIDGLDSYAPAVMALLSQVMALAADTVAAFRSEGDGEDAELFAAERRNMQRLLDAAAQQGIKARLKPHAGLKSRYQSAALAFLEQNLYRYPYTPFEDAPEGISVVEAQSLEQEVHLLASGILEQVRAGRRFLDIAVAGGALDAYLPVIKSVFAQHGIPFFIDERRALSENSFFSYLYSALCAAAGDMTAVTGYVYSDYAPLEAEQKARLRAYTQRYAYKGWHYYSEFKRGAGADEAEAIRKRVLKPLKALEYSLQSADAKAQAEAVRVFIHACNVQQRIETLCLGDEDAHGERTYMAQVHEKSLEVVSGIERIAAGRALSLQTFCSLIKAGFEATKIAVIPPATDEVKIFDISVGRLPSAEVLFAIGVHDGIWPARENSAGLFSAAEQHALRESGLDIGGYDLSEEKLKVYAAFCQPSRRLVVSHNAQTGQPSVLIDRLMRLFPKLKKASATPVFMSEADVLHEISEVMRGRQPQPKLAGICAHRMEAPGWREKAEGLLLRDNAALPLSEAEARALYGGMRCSATRIESFYRCPYKHFLDHGIRAQVQRDYEHDSIDIGTFMHLALDLFTKALLEDNADIKTLSIKQTQQRMKSAVAQAAAAHDSGKLIEDERFALMHAQLERELIGTALRIRSHFEGSGAAIYASEQKFEYAVETPLGRAVITGKIDRIDTAGSYFRVVDYKSSVAKFAADAFAAGTSLQLPVYIDAARRMLEGKGLLPAGGYYMRIGDKYHETKEQAEKDARMSGISLADAQVLQSFSAVRDGNGFAAIDQAVTAAGGLNARGAARLFSQDELSALLQLGRDMIGEAANKIWGGETAIAPAGEDACSLCDYKGICRVNAEYEGNAPRSLSPFDRSWLAGEGA